jgi:MFS family permease
MTLPTRPTSIRYAILALTVCVAILLYLDRYCLGYVAPYIKESLGLSDTQMAFLLSAFFLTYAFGQLPGGWLADRYGTRLMLTFYLATWSILTGLMGFANGFLTLVLLRFGCGLFEAGAYPASAGLIRRWIPSQRRGLASGVVSLGGRIGGAVVPALTGFLILAFTPVANPSSLSERDFLDPPRLARAVLLQPHDTEPIPEILRQLAPQLRAGLSAEQRQTFAAVAALPEGHPPTANQLQAMESTANGWVLNRDLFKSIDLSSVRPKLNEQALGLLGDEHTHPSTEQSARLNRYLLELAFPGSIRQVLGDGWQPVLMIYGAIGVALALVFFGFFRNSPREHFLTNQAEVELVEGRQAVADVHQPTAPGPGIWRNMVTDMSLWANCVAQFGTNFGWIFLGNNLAIYLQEIHQVPEGAKRGFMVSLPFLVSLPMLILGGWWTDRMTTAYGRRLGRAFPIAATRLATAVAFLVCFFLHEPWPIVIVLAAMAIVNDLGLPAFWGYSLDVGGRNVGLVLGWGNMWGNLGAFASPLVLFWLLGQFADRKTGYGAIFLTCAGVFLVSGIVACFIDATKAIGASAQNEDR